MEETSAASQNEGQARRVNEIDATGQTVAANVKRLRTDLGLTTAQLAERLEALGRPILANAITKIEQRQRRVSVDDLMALATALSATPNALLLPADVGERSQPTGVRTTVSSNVLWAWACGDRPLPLSADPQPGDWGEEGRAQRFRSVAAPHSTAPDAFLRYHETVERSATAMMALLQTAPQMADHVVGYAQAAADTWSRIAKVIEEHREELQEQTADMVALERALQLMKAANDD